MDEFLADHRAGAARSRDAARADPRRRAAGRVPASCRGVERITARNSAGYDAPIGLTADPVVFTLVDDRLCVLLARRLEEPQRGLFALPGGFVGTEESPGPDRGAQAAGEDRRRLRPPRAAAHLRRPAARPARLAPLDRLPRAGRGRRSCPTRGPGRARGELASRRRPARARARPRDDRRRRALAAARAGDGEDLVPARGGRAAAGLVHARARRSGSTRRCAARRSTPPTSAATSRRRRCWSTPASCTPTAPGAPAGSTAGSRLRAYGSSPSCARAIAQAWFQRKAGRRIGVRTLSSGRSANTRQSKRTWVPSVRSFRERPRAAAAQVAGDVDLVDVRRLVADRRRAGREAVGEAALEVLGRAVADDAAGRRSRPTVDGTPPLRVRAGVRERLRTRRRAARRRPTRRRTRTRCRTGRGRLRIALAQRLLHARGQARRRAPRPRSRVRKRAPATGRGQPPFMNSPSRSIATIRSSHASVRPAGRIWTRTRPGSSSPATCAGASGRAASRRLSPGRERRVSHAGGLHPHRALDHLVALGLARVDVRLRDEALRPADHVELEQLAARSPAVVWRNSIDTPRLGASITSPVLAIVSAPPRWSVAPPGGLWRAGARSGSLWPGGYAWSRPAPVAQLDRAADF